MHIAILHIYLHSDNNNSTMKTTLFTILIIGMLLMIASLTTKNIYLLGISEVIVIIPMLKLIYINLNTPIK